MNEIPGLATNKPTQVNYHDKYYMNLIHGINSDIHELFVDCPCRVYDVIGHEDIVEPDCIYALMEFAFQYGSPHVKARLSCYAAEWLMAYHELNEHKEK